MSITVVEWVGVISEVCVKLPCSSPLIATKQCVIDCGLSDDVVVIQISADGVTSHWNKCDM